MENLSPYLTTIVISCLIFGVFMLSLLGAMFFRLYRTHCSCGAAKQVLKTYTNRERNRKDAEKYDPQTLDVNDLPVISKDE